MSSLLSYEELLDRCQDLEKELHDLKTSIFAACRLDGDNRIIDLVRSSRQELTQLQESDTGEKRKFIFTGLDREHVFELEEYRSLL